MDELPPDDDGGEFPLPADDDGLECLLPPDWDHEDSVCAHSQCVAEWRG